MVAIEDIDKGTYIENKMRVFEAPSILADSSKASGIPIKKLRIKIRLKGATSVGIIMDQIVFVMPIPFTTRYVGMIPPLKNIVSTYKNKMNRRPGNPCLDNG
ncbi:hypothetical protein D3C71_1888340 [compost metagenome]